MSPGRPTNDRRGANRNKTASPARTRTHGAGNGNGATRTRTHGSSHKTSSIPRPIDPTRPRPAPVRRDDTRFGEFTRPIPRDKQLVQGKAKKGVVAIVALVITAALVAALFVLPVKAWLRQQDDLTRKQNELAALQQANADLTDEVARLQTPAGIEEAAREVIGYVQRGEIRLTVLPAPQAPLTLPSGWPYDELAQIVKVRQSNTTIQQVPATTDTASP